MFEKESDEKLCDPRRTWINFEKNNHFIQILTFIELF